MSLVARKKQEQGVRSRPCRTPCGTVARTFPCHTSDATCRPQTRSDGQPWWHPGRSIGRRALIMTAASGQANY